VERIKKLVGSERGIVLVITLLILTLLIGAGTGAIVSTQTDLKTSGNLKRGTQAFYLAEAGAVYAQFALNEDMDLDGNGGSQTQVFDNAQTVTWESTSQLDNLQAGSSGSVTIEQHPTDPNLAIITSEADFRSATTTIKLIVKKVDGGFPLGVRAAVTTNGPAATNGNMQIDGRDHDINGNLIAAQGTSGLYTGSTFSQGGSSAVGGTDSAVTDYAPAAPAEPSVIETGSNFDDPSTTAVETMPLTPDEVVGQPDGTLYDIANSGPPRGQYRTDPSLLIFPLSGVTYVELPCGSEWKPANIDGEGILVVHNSCRDALIKNLNSGTFKGLLIADDIVHIHTTIYGAVSSLTTAPSSGNVIGNGNGEVLFSREAIGNAGEILSGVEQVSWVEPF